MKEVCKTAEMTATEEALINGIKGTNADSYYNNGKLLFFEWSTAFVNYKVLNFDYDTMGKLNKGVFLFKDDRFVARVKPQPTLIDYKAITQNCESLGDGFWGFVVEYITLSRENLNKFHKEIMLDAQFGIENDCSHLKESLSFRQKMTAEEIENYVNIKTVDKMELLCNWLNKQQIIDGTHEYTLTDNKIYLDKGMLVASLEGEEIVSVDRNIRVGVNEPIVRINNRILMGLVNYIIRYGE